MNRTLETAIRGVRGFAFALLAAGIVTACGGGSEGPDAARDDTLEAADAASAQTVLHAVPPSTIAAATAADARKKVSDVVATSLRVHYHRLNSDYTGWQIHTWNAAQSPPWNGGWNASGSDDFGAYYDVPLAASSGTVGYLFHDGDTKDDNGADQSWTLVNGANEIWRVEGDLTTYDHNPLTAPPPDITTLRVHYIRFASDYANWGLHLWGGSGLDTSRMGGIGYGDWNNPTPFSAMPNYAPGSGEIVFDIPVLNPTTNPGTNAIEFLIHGMPPNVNDKDGRPNNIHVDFGGLTIANQVGQVWLVEQDATVYTAQPDLRSVSTTDARAVWLTGALVKWPRVAADGPVKLYWSATGAIVAAKDQPISGADGSITLDPYTGAVPTAAATRFKYVGNGGVFTVRAMDVPKLKKLLTNQ
ncbi:MAG TPA: pullulanase-associated domain-containing protein, partial [Burkholderiaceae bacterium]